MVIQRKPITAPLPCFALKYSAAVEKCQQCPHRTDCKAKMGDRVTMVEVSNLEFTLIPKAFGNTELKGSDPDFDMMQEVYVQCHNTVFGEDTRELVGPYKREIAARAEEANLSIRTFILACMFGYHSTKANAIGHTEAATRAFTPKTLTFPSAPATARTYTKLCREKFGAFSLSAITALSGEDFAKNDFTKQMLTSEVTAGTFIIGWKLKNDGLPYRELFSNKEVDLSPHWLATCPHYEEIVLKPYTKEQFGSRMERRHRSAVIHVIRDMGRNRNTAKAVFYARQLAAPESVKQVLGFFGYRSHDIESVNKPVTDMLTMWLDLARCIQQVEAMKYVNGLPSHIDRIFSGSVSSSTLAEHGH